MLNFLKITFWKIRQKELSERHFQFYDRPLSNCKDCNVQMFCSQAKQPIVMKNRSLKIKTTLRAVFTTVVLSTGFGKEEKGDKNEKKNRKKIRFKIK